jgi:hypothetical protein
MASSTSSLIINQSVDDVKPSLMSTDRFACAVIIPTASFSAQPFGGRVDRAANHFCSAPTR